MPFGLIPKSRALFQSRPHSCRKLWSSGSGAGARCAGGCGRSRWGIGGIRFLPARFNVLLAGLVGHAIKRPPRGARDFFEVQPHFPNPGDRGGLKKFGQPLSGRRPGTEAPDKVPDCLNCLPGHEYLAHRTSPRRSASADGLEGLKGLFGVRAGEDLPGQSRPPLGRYTGPGIPARQALRDYLADFAAKAFLPRPDGPAAIGI